MKNPASTTVVFADLTGSTRVFESLGNEKATQAITRLTAWMGQVCAAYKGRMVKNLGDGVLVVFADAQQALNAVVEMQRKHSQRIDTWPAALRMHLQVGVASGEVVEVDGDCYGDAVNVASRLSDLSGAEQIWVTESVIDLLPHNTLVRYRSLGRVAVRGRNEAPVVYRVEWHEALVSELLTRPAGIHHLEAAGLREDSVLGKIELSWLDASAAFRSSELPVHLGRDQEAEFAVSDPRVSRLHARLEWRGGAFVLIDMSSYGTWVRFKGSDSVQALRREECRLTADGEIAMGAPFEDFTVPTVAFTLSGLGVSLTHRPSGN